MFSVAWSFHALCTVDHRYIIHITRWAKWIIFVKELNLLLPYFGLLSMYYSQHLTLPTAQHHSTISPQPHLSMSLYGHSWFKSQRKRTGRPTPTPLFRYIYYVFICGIVHPLPIPRLTSSRPTTSLRRGTWGPSPTPSTPWIERYGGGRGGVRLRILRRVGSQGWVRGQSRGKEGTHYTYVHII